ncbi:hypothetical protein EDEG_03956 [Edhazardia aedis USNM 41457]|uniref:Uncharacterized protein n=1 Tax=Edhazardia aedis (strain USNM 41457) TaxID=1003232 RepID=J8ZNZ7_EDHAE|nr:hypothetical protein EDEG_03956 [Edhazardia aedis USNM 41457]|eukprot:EJW01423.1 hypothetical protein EDEG_03956 [Edhazardia aedis USNM 41457]
MVFNNKKSNTTEVFASIWIVIFSVFAIIFWLQTLNWYKRTNKIKILKDASTDSKKKECRDKKIYQNFMCEKILCKYIYMIIYRYVYKHNNIPLPNRHFSIIIYIYDITN